MKSELPIKTPYVFRVVTNLGDVVLHMPETEWDIGEKANIQGEESAVMAFRQNAEVAIGMYGTPLSIDFTTPMDINAGLCCLKDRGEIDGFEILSGHIPDESPRQVGDDGEPREVELGD